MKTDPLYSLIALSHDLTSAFETLTRAALHFAHPSLEHLRPTARSADPSASPPPRSVYRNLMTAAIGFTIQMAIDVAGRDPDEMRKLERELMTAADRR